MGLGAPPNRIYTELGVHLYVFVALTIELRSMGYVDSQKGKNNLHMCATGLSVRHVGEHFQRSNVSISKYALVPTINVQSCVSYVGTASSRCHASPFLQGERTKIEERSSERRTLSGTESHRVL